MVPWHSVVFHSIYVRGHKLAALWGERVPIITAHVLLDLRETG